MRAPGNDLCELFGYAPDDTSEPARKQWKTQECPFVGGPCVKHSHTQRGGTRLVYGSCSVTNRLASTTREEVIICPQRLYANDYAAIKACAADAGITAPMYMADEYSRRKRSADLHNDYCVLLGKNSGREISLSNPGVIDLSLDWVMAYVDNGVPQLLVPCEVQSIDTTGNYRNNWNAYAHELSPVPSSEHGMNWANVWKRLIPQLILKAAVAATSTLCTMGTYFVVPDRVFVQFERLVGPVTASPTAGKGIITVMTYKIGQEVERGEIRPLVRQRTERMLATDFAQSFAAGRQLPLGTQLDQRVAAVLASL